MDDCALGHRGQAVDCALLRRAALIIALIGRERIAISHSDVCGSP